MYARPITTMGTIAERRQVSGGYNEQTLDVDTLSANHHAGYRPKSYGTAPSSTATSHALSSCNLSSRSTPSSFSSVTPLTPPDDRSWACPSTRSTVFDDFQRLCLPDSASTLYDPAILGQSHSPSGRERTKSARQYATASELHSLMESLPFGSPIREKAAEMLKSLLVGEKFKQQETVGIVEYGAVSGRSSDLVGVVASHINREHAKTHADATNLTFNVTHADLDGLDMSRVWEDLGSRSGAYTSADWQHRQSPSLVDRIFAYTANRPANQMVCAPNSVNVGFSLLDLQWTAAIATSSIGMIIRRAAFDLDAFFSARAREFKSGGILIVAYPQRLRPIASTQDETKRHSLRQSTSSGLSPPENTRMLRSRSGSTPVQSSSSRVDADTWQSMASTLQLCIQRLVACQLVHSDIAARMLALPLHVRTPQQTLSAIRNASTEWSVAWSCGLETVLPFEDRSGNAVQSEKALHLVHPACKAFAAGQLSNQVYAEHVLTFVRNIWEGHFLHVLRETGGIGRTAVAAILATLWQAFREKVEDGALQHLAIDVCMVALERR